MAAQNGCRRYTENQKRWLILKQMCLKIKANKVTFPTKFGIPDLMERFVLYSETIFTFESKIVAQ